MFESSRDKDAEVTLCIFPHLGEFVVIDMRSDLPQGPAVHLMTIEEVLGDDFLSRMEVEFSKLIRRKNLGFLGLMGMPQEVEGLIRSMSLRRVIDRINRGSGGGPVESIGSIGVLFFTGQMLGLDAEQLRQAVKDLFSRTLTPGQIETLIEKLAELTQAERTAETAANRSDLARLITGESGQYGTIWKR